METAERDKLIAGLLAEGHSLSDVQKILKDEHRIQLTYMELRMISVDLEVDWKQFDPPDDPDADDDADAPAGGDDASTAGGTHVEVSKVVRPGAVMSGEVTFQSGARAEWFLDQMGRLGLNPIGDSDKPSEDDLREFQVELQRKLQGPM